MIRIILYNMSVNKDVLKDISVINLKDPDPWFLQITFHPERFTGLKSAMEIAEEFVEIIVII